MFMVSNKSVAILAQAAMKSRGAGHADARMRPWQELVHNFEGQPIRLLDSLCALLSYLRIARGSTE